jgi:tetratricopeptide (TPR) repeat protein
MQESIKVFYSHSKNDKKYLEDLKTHLSAWNDDHLISEWSDDDMSAGDEWNLRIEDALVHSDIVIFLTSPTSLTSKYIKEKEIPLTLTRLEKGDDIVIFPVLLRDCAWEANSLLKRFQGRPKINGELTPLDNLASPQLNTQLKNIAREIRTLAEQMRDRKEDMRRNDVKFSETEKLLPSVSSLCLSFPDCSNNFYGREIELNLLENQVQESRVVVMYGEPGVGKTDLASQLAKRLSTQYEIFWLDVKGGEKLSLEELFLHIGEFLKAHGEQGFVTTYAMEKEAGINITPKNKVDTLVTLLGEISKKSKYLFFIDNFQRTDLAEVNYFIERFLSYGNNSRLVLIERFPNKSLSDSVFGNKIKKFSVNGFKPDDASQYVQKLCQDYTVQWTNQAIRQIYQKTDGHPQAITLIVIWAHTQGDSLKNVMDNLVDFDKQDGSTLSQKLLQDVAKDLEAEERKVLQYLSLFRTSFHRKIQVYSNIPNYVWRSLVQYRWIKSEGCDNFRMHSLIAEFWRSSASESENIEQWHEKIANYYWTQGKENSLEFVDRDCYLESHYHWRKINKVEKAAQVLNELISHIHNKERLPSERLPGLSSWLLRLDESTMRDFPWLLLEKGRKFEKMANFNDANNCFKSAYQVFNSQRDNLGSSVSLYYIGKMLYLIPDYQRTLETLEEVLEIVENDNLMQIRTLGKIVKCYLHLDQVEEAADYANKAKQLAIECGDELGLALILYHQGSIYRRQSDFQKAEKYYYESAKLFEKLGEVYRQSKSLARLGRCQQFQTKYKEAEENLKEAIKLKTDINWTVGSLWMAEKVMTMRPK